MIPSMGADRAHVAPRERHESHIGKKVKEMNRYGIICQRGNARHILERQRLGEGGSLNEGKRLEKRLSFAAQRIFDPCTRNKVWCCSDCAAGWGRVALRARDTPERGVGQRAP